jgi:multisubunit Na+/H+ antiporter MnhF subunit
VVWSRKVSVWYAYRLIVRPRAGDRLRAAATIAVYLY